VEFTRSCTRDEARELAALERKRESDVLKIAGFIGRGEEAITNAESLHARGIKRIRIRLQLDQLLAGRGSPECRVREHEGEATFLHEFVERMLPANLMLSFWRGDRFSFGQ